MERVAIDYVRLRTSQERTTISNRFQRDAKYGTYFHGFVGVLYGTHIPVMITPGCEGLRFINKNELLVSMFWRYVIMTCFHIMLCGNGRICP